MAKSSLKITKNTVSSGIDQYVDVLFNRTKAVLSNAAADIMDSTSNITPVDTTRLQNSFKQGGRSKQTVNTFKIPFLKDEKEAMKFPNISKIFGTSRVTKDFFGGDDTVAEFTYKPRREVSIKFGTKVPYARYVELGSSRIAPRLFFTNTLNEKRSGVRKYLIENLTVK